ncbi:dephospho-CoA kinase [Oxalobacteraceae bacterium A2-2]
MSAPFSIGLTGGIGSGKSTVSALFAARGATIVDTDRIAHAMTAPHGPAMAAIASEFGQEFVAADGALDRARMRALVFADPQAKARLEGILHPAIRAAAAAEGMAAGGSYVIYDVPLLVEAGNWRERVDRILVVDCPEELQLKRVLARSQLPETQVRAIMASQATRAQRLAAADDVVVNEAGLDALPPQIDRLHDIYLAFSRGRGTIPSQRL